MELPTCILDRSKTLVLDASVLINVAASECGERLLKAIPNPVVASSIVIAEIEHGRVRGRRTPDLVSVLRSRRIVAVRDLGIVAQGVFEALVVGPAVATVDDGEAATIALAVEMGGVAVNDEKKASRLASLRHPDLALGCSVDLFCHPDVVSELGAEGLADAVATALVNARMRVLDRHLDWVRELIGPERAAGCTSLPRKSR